MPETSEKPVLIRGRELTLTSWDQVVIADYTNALTSSSSVAVLDVAAGDSQSRSFSTRSEKLYFGRSGVAHFDVEGAEYLVGPGDLLVIPVRSASTYQAKSEAVTLLLIQTPTFDRACEVVLD